jgi:hypothetical protein
MLAYAYAVRLPIAPFLVLGAIFIASLVIFILITRKPGQ